MKLYSTTPSKSFWYNYSRLAIISIGLTLSACQTTHQQNKQAIAPYLNQYIGQRTDQLEQKFNLDTFNIQPKPNSITTSDRAIFSFDRLLSIPIPAGNMVMESRRVIIPEKIASVDKNNKTNQPCNIIFVLKTHMVKSVTIKGKAC